MKRYLPTLVVYLAFLCSSPSWAGDLVKAGLPCGDTPHGCLPPRVPKCPDDYCRKPIPCISGLSSCRTCDDYCRKPIPCAPCLCHGGTCDDYCRKPLPYFCWPVLDNMRCVPSCSPCDPPAPTKAVRPSKAVTANIKG